MKYAILRDMKPGFQVEEIKGGKRFIIGKNSELIYEDAKGKMVVLAPNSWTTIKQNEREKDTFMKLLLPSLPLATLLGSTKPMTRPKVVQGVWKFIKENKLQCEKNRRTIKVGNHPLTKAIFKRQQVSMFEMTKHITKHLSEI